MSAVLKKDLHRLRAARSDRLGKQKVPVLRTVRDGTVIIGGVTMDVLATPMSPKARHQVSWSKT